ncbi:unnamed protein product [Litomosoides sigmodontis]|uniref:Uncharacterized protein n=1 Tax=Litomosoides sigmodontis TaxID=42156 RepID=A0A3P6TI56_LITSI|nr:unnamed protein product [Litomosoides sigmodontis]
MGHHHFDSALKSKSPDIETDITDQVERMNLNGLQRVTQEHQQLVEQIRHRLRDRISSRMGELLLLAEFQHLKGILMENHRGIRSCVTCDMVNTELSMGHDGSNAVLNNDDLNDLNSVATEYGNASRSIEVLQSPAQFPVADSPARTSMNIDVLRTDFLRSRNVRSALEAVDDKLKWCAERLKSCENTEEVLKLYETIDRGIGILKHLVDT